MCQFAVVEMGIPYETFMRQMTPYEFSVALKVYRQKKKVEEMDDRYKMSVQRLLAVSSINPHLKHKIKTPEELFKFWWELTEQDQNQETSTEELKDMDLTWMFGSKKDK